MCFDQFHSAQHIMRPHTVYRSESNRIDGDDGFGSGFGYVNVCRAVLSRRKKDRDSKAFASKYGRHVKT